MSKTLVIREVDPSVRELVAQNDGYCPCAVVKTPDTKCMCKEFKDQQTTGLCHCGRYGKFIAEVPVNENMTAIGAVENPRLVSQVQQAIRTIKAGICKRVDVTKEIKVYECGSIIRIDIKP